MSSLHSTPLSSKRKPTKKPQQQYQKNTNNPTHRMQEEQGGYFLKCFLIKTKKRSTHQSLTWVSQTAGHQDIELAWGRLCFCISQEQWHRQWDSWESTLPARLLLLCAEHFSCDDGKLHSAAQTLLSTNRSPTDWGRNHFNKSAFSKHFWRGFPIVFPASPKQVTNTGYMETHLWQ